MEITKWLKRETFAPIHLAPGDTIRLLYKQSFFHKEKKLCEAKIDEPMVITEAAAFKGIVENRKCIGGAFIEMEKEV